jgi:hypothetical protein
MDHLSIKEILQLTINAIDNETLWEKHYENLRKIEKDLPELVKQDKDNENSEMPDSLDKLKISDFLKLELNVYGDKNHELVNFLINNIEDIFIPHVFNFKERLKLTLCAACHIAANVQFFSESSSDEFSYDKLVKKFETLDNLEMEHNTEEVPVSETDYTEKLNEINILLRTDKENAESHEKQKNNYDERKKKLTESHKTPRTRSAAMMGGTTVDGVSVINNYTANEKVDIDINEIFEDIPGVKKLNWDGDNLIDKFKNCYEQLSDNEDDNEELRQRMFTCLKWISFNGMLIGVNAPPAHNKVFKILNEALKKHIKEKYFPVLNGKNKDDLMELVEKNLQDPKWKFSNFTEFLKHFYFTSNDSTGKNKNAIIPQTKKDFNELYLNTDINKQTPILLFFDIRDSTNDIFKRYIYILFEYLCATTLKDIIQGALEKEKQDIGKMSKHTMRIQDISNYYNSLNDANNPLLRAFLLFVRDCVHVMSNIITKISEENKDEFWYRLENSLGNHISLEDETIKCDGNDSDTTSLFDYIEKQLTEKGIVDSGINLLVNKAKLIYLLQNYKCF